MLSGTEPFDKLREVGDGGNMVGAGGCQRRLRHTIYDRALAVLHHCDPARSSDAAKPFRAVSSHSGENDSDRRRPEATGDAREERIGGGGPAPYRSPRIEAELPPPPRARP